MLKRAYRILSVFALCLAASVASGQNDARRSPSILDANPELAFITNYSPLVFGMPGSFGGDMACRTQLSGDWGGSRCKLVDRGVLIDVYSTTGHQEVVSGGLNTVGASAQSTDLAINLDTGRLGWWRQGLLHMTLMSRYGSGLDTAEAAGAIVPANAAYLYPAAEEARATLPAEYYLAQGIGEKHVLVLGKINTVFVADRNALGGNYRYQFQNTAFNLNPMLGQYVSPVAWVAGDVWRVGRRVRIYTAIADPRSSASNFADDAFRNVTYYQQIDYFYNARGLPGTIRGAWAFTTKQLTVPSSPVNVATFASPEGPTTRKEEIPGSYIGMLNFEQYLKVVGDKAENAQRLRAGLQLRGYGVFGRFGTGPPSFNLIHTFGSLGFSGYGVARSRPDDRMGVAWYFCHFSRELGGDLAALARSRGLTPAHLRSEQAIEAFYSFAITPAVQVTPSFQYVWNPLAAGLAGRDHAATWFLRLEMAL